MQRLLDVTPLLDAARAPHACDTSHPTCPCGRRWDYRVSAPGDHPRHTSADVVATWERLYGPHPYAVRLHHGGAR